MTPQQTQQIITHLLPYQPTRIGVFGSYARGDNKPDSDLDLLVNFGVPMDLIKLMNVWDTLEDALGVHIDLVTENALKRSNPRVQESIASDLQVIYEV
ncbi:nucleotidyltransferase family protein [Spirosoma sp. KCTC 42546]|uniref:nucleotidyltransferase family protein n=1 Tax=Spirosoma sp. KCTC 42546 TaxID=2520506 RepID=UPI00115AA349|nr:nucleotidyltransferase family protein [Spirosoma sp. KCTC 42546]QDK78228.1 nucleotidyltransferase family protein [Spirosoma sp. KCTC 42546]